MNSSAINTHQLVRHQGTFQLGPLDWTVPEGAFYALVGPNGAGKSTLLDLLMGMGHAHRGSVQVLGMDLEADEVAIKRRVAYVSPELNYQSWGRVGRAIDFVSGFYPDWDSDRCERLMRDFEMDRSAKIQTLSFGARTKLSLILALSRKPDLLLLDEPTTGLDAIARKVLFTELLSILRSEGRTIVISSHQLTDLERFADHIGILHEGKLLLSGRMDEVVQQHVEVEIDVGNLSIPTMAGTRVLKREGQRVRLLVDRRIQSSTLPLGPGMRFITECPVTLEQLFLDLVQPALIPSNEVKP